MGRALASTARPLGFQLLLPDRLLLCTSRRPCRRAFSSHEGPAAARTSEHHVHVMQSCVLADVLRHDQRVSADARRGAAAYGDASRSFREARTHGCLPNLRWIIEIQGGFLHNFLR